jgi:hypothetical protein
MYPRKYYKKSMPKDATEKFRLSSKEKADLRKAAKLARIPVSILIRLCLTSKHHVGSHPDMLRSAAHNRTSL